jgi:ATP-binding cassette subfamily F protein 3
MQTAEKKLETLNAALAVLDTKLAEPELYMRDPAGAQKVQLERGQLAKQLSAAEDEWLAATEAYELAEQETAALSI